MNDILLVVRARRAVLRPVLQHLITEELRLRAQVERHPIPSVLFEYNGLVASLGFVQAHDRDLEQIEGLLADLAQDQA